MHKPMFSVFDSKAGVFCNPFVATNQACAIRDFGFSANDPNSAVSRHPSDFALFLVAEMDDETATIIPQTPIQNLGFASQFKEGK